MSFRLRLLVRSGREFEEQQTANAHLNHIGVILIYWLLSSLLYG